MTDGYTKSVEDDLLKFKERLRLMETGKLRCFEVQNDGSQVDVTAIEIELMRRLVTGLEGSLEAME